MVRKNGFTRTGLHVLLMLALIAGMAGCKKNTKAATRITPTDDTVAIETDPGSDAGEGAGGMDSINTADLPPREGGDLNTGDYGTAVNTSGQAFLKTVYFDYDRSDIRSDQSGQLEENAAWILQQPRYKILIEGHCDERGSNEYNLGLGQRRADAVLKFFVEQGIPLERLNTISYGEERPADPGHSESAWSLNRRAEFKVRE